MAQIIKGNRDGENDRNETYRIPGRDKEIPRDELVKEVEEGKHPNFEIYERDGEKYVRGKPDGINKNNVNA